MTTPAFGSTRRVPASEADRRNFPRHRPRRRTTCLLRDEAGLEMRASLFDLSAQGVALVSDKWFASGTQLTVWLFNQEVTVCVEAKLRVKRSSSMTGGGYFVAGELDRVLEPAELLPFLL